LRGSFERLSSALGAGLYRIAQEAITNAAKHARATRVDIILRRLEENIELVVADNGKACDAQGVAKSGLGLLGIRERTAALGGRLSFESGQPTGLVLCVVVPAPQAVLDEGHAECPA
jgi:signal transduction histidine kinase